MHIDSIEVTLTQLKNALRAQKSSVFGRFATKLSRKFALREKVFNFCSCMIHCHISSIHIY